VTSVGVLAHTGKSLAGALPAFRAVLAKEWVDAPHWYEL